MSALDPMIAVVLMALAGGLGAVTRFVVDAVIRARVRSDLPIGTWIINVTGSFALGLLTAVVLRHAVSPQLRLILGTGFLGGYTTFSTACVETVRLIQQGRRRFALVKALIVVLTCLGAASLGFWLGV